MRFLKRFTTTHYIGGYFVTVYWDLVVIVLSIPVGLVVARWVF